jgi:hypothetical protein
LIQIHNKSTYNRIYNRYSAEFIDAYCTYKVNGQETKDALISAKIIVQATVSLELTSNNPNKKIILKAYKNINNDTKLIEKAIKYYQGLK